MTSTKPNSWFLFPTLPLHSHFRKWHLHSSASQTQNLGIILDLLSHSTTNLQAEHVSPVFKIYSKPDFFSPLYCHWSPSQHPLASTALTKSILNTPARIILTHTKMIHVTFLLTVLCDFRSNVEKHPKMLWWGLTTSLLWFPAQNLSYFLLWVVLYLGLHSNLS